MNNEKKIELLAPARDISCGMVAINCGADAVYIGAARFGAREQADNSLHDIAELVNYAHLYWARVYVAVNTILLDHEIDEAVRLIHQLYQIGIDGLIIQDAGLLECDLPPLPLIASTQMHNDLAEKVAFLEQVGFQRVILARELSLDQIVAIRKTVPSVELEFFIHGALCVSYSGQCYLSYAIGGRSGNRGQCAQPCRRRYRLVDKNSRMISDWRHLLSLRDLNLSQHLGDLIDAGITAFKIEGRLKDPAYVMNVVAHYRLLLDRILQERGLQKSSSGQVHLDFIPNPNKTFNRNYTDYFLTPRNRKLATMGSPKYIGEPVGRVAAIKGDHFVLQMSMEALHNGDGISFFDEKGELHGTTVNRAQGLAIYPDKMAYVEPNTMIHRNSDRFFLAQLDKSRAERKIGLVFNLSEGDKGLLLTAIDEDGIQASCFLANEKESANKPEIALDNIRCQLSKTGGTAFECREVQIDLRQIYFIPISTLNGLRRDAIERLSEARMQNHPLWRFQLQANSVPYPEKNLTFQGNVLNQKAADFYRRHGVDHIEPAAESGIDMRDRRVMSMKYCLRYQLDLCDGGRKKSAPPEPWYLIDEQGRRFQLQFDCQSCHMEVYFQGET